MTRPAALNLFEPPVGETAPRLTVRRVASGVLIGTLLGAGLAAHIFAFGWWQRRDVWLGSPFAGTVVIATAAGLVAYFAFFAALKRLKLSATPWLAAAVSLWLVEERLVHFGPFPVDFSFIDPRPTIAVMALVACAGLCVVAIIAFMDWRIRQSERASPERSQP